MTILYVLIPLAVVLMGIAVWFFFWSVKSGQYDDMEGPAHRILMDDDDPRIPPPFRVEGGTGAEEDGRVSGTEAGQDQKPS